MEELEHSAAGPGERGLEAAPFRLEGFAIGEVVGRGSYGIVYRARELAHNRSVALKRLTASLDETARNVFETECKAMGALSGHPNIVTLYFSGIDAGGRAYLVMDFMGGGSLADALREQGPFGWREVVDIGVRLAGGLETAHRAGVLHGDVKPENVLVSAYGEPKLGDFGISLAIDAAAERPVTGMTPLHAAPEVLMGQTPSVRSDVYALASMMFALIAGAPAFGGLELDHIAALVHRVTESAVPDLRAEGVPDALCRVVEQAMAKDPAERHCSAAAFGEDLQAVQQALGLAPTAMQLSRDGRPMVGRGRPPPPIDGGDAVATPAGASSVGHHGLHLTVPADIRVTPGGEAAATAVVRNTGLVDEIVEVTVQGLPEAWVTVEPRQLHLETRASSGVVIRVRPPRLSTTAPGPRPFDVSVWSTTNPNVRCTERRDLTVERFVEGAASISPATSDRQGGYMLTVINRGNSTLMAEVDVHDPDDRLRVTCQSPTIAVESGAECRLDLRAVPRRRIVFGRPFVHLLRAVVTPEAGHAVVAETMVAQRPLVARWLQVTLALTLLVGLALGGQAWRQAGVPTPPVPEVTGLGVDKATLLLKQAGFEVTVKADSSSQESSGIVIDQRPTAGVKLRTGSAVLLVVSASAPLN